MITNSLFSEGLYSGEKRIQLLRKRSLPNIQTVKEKNAQTLQRPRDTIAHAIHRAQGTRGGGGKRNTHRISFQSWRAEAELRRTRTWPHGYGQITVCHSCAQCQWHPPSTGTLDWDPEDSCETKSFRNWQTTLLTQMFQIFIALILPRRNLHAHKLKCNQWRYYEFTQRRGGTKSQGDNKT